MVKSLVLSTILLGIFWSCRAIDLHPRGDEAPEAARAGTTHNLSKREIQSINGLPGLGGEDLAGKVFTVTGSRVTQSNNFIPTRQRKALTFIANPEKLSQEKDANNSSLIVDPRSQQKLNNNRLLSTVTEPEKSDGPIDESLDGKIEKVDSPSSDEVLVSLKETNNLARRALFRRSLFTPKLVEKRKLRSTTASDSSTYLGFQVFQESQRNLGEFPALGGLTGTISSEGARKTVDATKSSVGPNPSPSVDSRPGVKPELSGSQASGKFVLQFVE